MGAAMRGVKIRQGGLGSSFDKIFCSGGEALGGIVASPSCTEYQLGAFIAFCEVSTTPPYSAYYFIYPQLCRLRLHNCNGRINLVISIRQLATDELKN
jgi:hypothetical protein